VDLQTRLHLWLIHDGAPSRSLLAVQELLNVFPGQGTKQGGLTAWLPRSSDLIPLDFYLWGLIKRTVYATEVSDVPDEYTMDPR
jgi:hypothetical protein